MGQIAHPDTGESIDVEVIDSESDGMFVQVAATDDSISLSDESGDNPWLRADEVENLNDA